MKMEAMVASLSAILQAISSGKQASISYVGDDPHVRVADLYLLPLDVLPRISPDDGDAFSQLAGMSIGDVLREGGIRIKDVSSNRLIFEWQSAGSVLQELLRADLDNDGVEEILIQHYVYATEGTLGIASIGMLKRTGLAVPFTYAPYS
jgi:hypothetical protein